MSDSPGIVDWIRTKPIPAGGGLAGAGGDCWGGSAPGGRPARRVCRRVRCRSGSNAYGLRAYQGRCAHQDELLGEGDIDDDFLICRNHGWRFDVETRVRQGGPQAHRLGGPTRCGRRVPFGSGPRVCPGRSLALLEIQVVLALLYKNLDVTRVGRASTSARSTPSRCAREAEGSRSPSQRGGRRPRSCCAWSKRRQSPGNDAG
jgi:hypothetical protein